MPSGVRANFVVHDRIHAVVGKGIARKQLDNPLPVRRCTGVIEPHALLPQSEMPQDALDHLAFINQGDDARSLLI